ncbi:MAG: hypothetical protein CL942_16020 [Desulfovibrio sp.]|nr:hypothetical protein [Desulfovibrio sp.]|tara:strand:- start:727 stop:1911 length:1185 start_codon:yes stop_codon:yes gene_type:complete
MDKETLLQLVENDPLGLLEVKKRGASASSPDEIMIEAFLKVNAFYAEHGREPEKKGDERTLFSNLNGFRKYEEKRQVVIGFDEYGLLAEPEEEKIEVPAPESIDDIFDNDPLGLLGGGGDLGPLSPEEDIFTLKHVPQSMPEYVAQREKCEDFDKFEPLFKQCHQDLKEGHRRIIPFSKGGQIRKGLFYVLKGVVLYVAKVGKKERMKGAMNARLRCIFENGTESDMLLRSLAAELYKDGRGITEHHDKLLDGFSNITEDDEEAGFIYVVRSLSEDEKIKSIPNLYKIGFTRKSVEDRLKDVTNDPTFLMADVSFVKAYKCFNMNSQRLEQKLHAFFGKVCLNIDIYDKPGRRHVPREWFMVPLEAIEQAIYLLLEGKITDFVYDVDREMIVGN